MGVRQKLDETICPDHRAREEEKELFVPRTNHSTRQNMLFCTACRCEVPMGSKQVHSQGRRHMANIVSRSQSRQNQ
uniref:U1-type domain-containing protein n=1 Tax=Caenorhabditis tropicalis TaxID=1561998 RepID=A0A1I7UY75_9PELO